jgi:hypothetical protein
MDSVDQAKSFPRGDLELVVCETCAFVFNRLFRPEAVDYTMPYEESQAYSPRFQEFENELVDHLVSSYDLNGKEILEIGCGKASFLEKLCLRTGGPGVGIDPAFEPGRVASDVDLIGLKEFYDSEHIHLTGDLICSRHTLEHIQPVGEFMELVRKSAQLRPDSVIFFEIPDADRIFNEGAFWDVYYEHCSYFTLPSLEALFKLKGFRVLQLRRGYDDQYLLIDAVLGTPDSTVNEAAVAEVVDKAQRFGAAADKEIEAWRELVTTAHDEGKSVVLWGASSKAVGFLSAIRSDAAVDFAVDINPFKQEKFLPGSGLSVIGPAELTDLKPELVVVMNPIYVPEIKKMLDDLGLNPEVRALGAVPEANA